MTAIFYAIAAMLRWFGCLDAAMTVAKFGWRFSPEAKVRGRWFGDDDSD